MLIKQALSEVLQLVASQLLTLQAVAFACLRLLRKTEKLAWRRRGRRTGCGQFGGRLEPKSPPAFVAKEKNADRGGNGRKIEPVESLALAMAESLTR
jgi:hypothetical protein